MNIVDFMNKKEYDDKYIFIGNNTVSDILLERYLGEYEVSSYLPKGGLITKNRVVRNEDILSKDWEKIKRNYKFVIQAEKYDGRRKLFKSAKEKEVVDTTLDSNREFYINQVKKKLNINFYNAKKLVDVKQDVNLIYNEVQKLKYLTKTEIEDYIQDLLKKEANAIFDFINSVIEKEDYLYQKKMINDHPLKVLYMITQQLRGLIICKNLIGQRNKEIADKYDLHPFQVQIFKSQVSNYTLEELIDLFKECCEQERRIKTGKISPELALDYICIRIFTT